VFCAIISHSGHKMFVKCTRPLTGTLFIIELTGCFPGYHCWLSLSGDLTLLISDTVEQSWRLL